MNRPRTLFLLALAATLASLASPRAARAGDRPEVEAAASIGLASNPMPSVYFHANNALHVGLGLRAGVILFGGLYGGAKLVDYLGSTTTIFETSIPVEEHAFQEGLELGWNFKLLGLLSIRPQIGVGNITFSGTANSPYFTPSGVVLGTNRASSGSSIYIEPGLTALVSFGPLVVGGDMSYLKIPDYPDSTATYSTHAFTARVQVGVRFGVGGERGPVPEDPKDSE